MTVTFEVVISKLLARNLYSFCYPSEPTSELAIDRKKGGKKMFVLFKWTGLVLCCYPSTVPCRQVQIWDRVAAFHGSLQACDRMYVSLWEKWLVFEKKYSNLWLPQIKWAASSITSCLFMLHLYSNPLYLNNASRSRTGPALSLAVLIHGFSEQCGLVFECMSSGIRTPASPP